LKVALISDIHGNEVALDAVLGAIGRERPDQIVCLGDVAQGPRPREVLARLRELRCPVVRGNGDIWHLEPASLAAEPLLNEPGMEDLLGPHVETNAWIREQLSESDLDYLRTFRPSVELPLGGGATLLCYHGSPRHYLDFLLASTPDEQVEDMLAGRRATVMAGGHTHMQMVRRFREITLVNPGSVGMPVSEASSPIPELEGPALRPARAEYALISREERALSVELRQVPVEADAVRRMVRDSGMPHAQMHYGIWVDE
jgi:predicted phosphodiesterase